jgi:serine/threonine protein kinase
VISILRGVARLLAPHNHDTVHRNVKPDNVLLSASSATVTDFGVAKAIPAGRTTAESGHRPACRFGVGAYEPAGHPPFRRASPAKLLAATAANGKLKLISSITESLFRTSCHGHRHCPARSRHALVEDS